MSGPSMPPNNPPPRPNPKVAALRDAGDAARDQRDWPRAAVHYRAYLAQAEHDAAIWVQLGHALKEQGQLAAAEAPYRRAIALLPEDADARLQLGHLCKLLGRTQEALEAYAAALTLAPLVAAHDEMVALGDAGLAATLMAEWRGRLPDGAVLLEVTDLLVYLRDHRTVSGIQRVQLGLLGYVLALPAEERAGYALVRRRGEDAALWRLDMGRMGVLARYLAGAVVERTQLDHVLNALEADASPVQPRAGQVLMVLGAFWVGGSVAPAYAAAKAAGVSIGAYIYDLIPLTHPEFCDATLVAQFTRSLAEGVAFFDFLLAISEHSAQAMRGWLAAQGLAGIPVQAVPLAHDFRLPGQILPPPPPRWPAAIAELQGQEFVLCVGTIEARKNHAYLFQLWKNLLAEGLAMPRLVLVGRFGWRVAELFAQMQATGFLAGHIVVLHDLSDAELAQLYRGCLFTIFPSFVEGWGLPVGESLSHGKLCLASEGSSLPEVGGALVDYIDPLNLRSGLAAVRRYVTNRPALAAREAEIARGFRHRGWAEVGAAFFPALRRLAAAPPRPLPWPVLAQGDVFRPAALVAEDAAPLPGTAPRLLLAEGWLPPFPLGAEADPKAPATLLRFGTDAPVGAEVTVYLQLRLLGAEPGCVVLASPALGQAQRLVVARPRGHRLVNLRLSARVDASGQVELRLSLPVLPGAARREAPPRLMLHSLAHAASDDALARLAVMEALLLG